VKFFAPIGKIAVKADFHKWMSQKCIQRGIVGVELLCYKVKYTRAGKLEKISTGIMVKTNPDSITIMDVMQDTTRTYLLLGEKKFEKEVKKNSFSKTITEAMQDGK
jgi:hypothetical protein